jgi:hypothetical protein
VKSSLEIEQEELEKIPKFKAKPLNKKVSPLLNNNISVER